MCCARHTRADRVLDAVARVANLFFLIFNIFFARVANLVCAARGSLESWSRPVVTSEALRATLEAVADLVQVVRAVVHPSLAGEHQQLTLGVSVPLLPRVVPVLVVVVLHLPGLVLQALQVKVPHVVVAAGRPHALSFSSSTAGVT